MAKVDERNYPFSSSLGFNYVGQYDSYDFPNSVFYIGSGETAYGFIDHNSHTLDIDWDGDYSDTMTDFIGFETDENPEI